MRRINSCLALVFISGIITCTSSYASSMPVYEEAQKYYRGQGVEKDYAKALKLFKQAYYLEPYEARTACFIGNVYASGGYGVEKSRDLAIRWYQQSINDGQASTYCRLIDLYLSFSDPSQRDLAKAVECARKLEKAEACCSKWADLSYVAKAYAYAGMFDDAVRVQNEAILLYKESGTSTPSGMEKYQSRLVAYEQKKVR